MLEESVAAAVAQHFPGHRHSLMTDPEDDHVWLIRLYDVPDDQTGDFRERLWDMIESIPDFDSISALPSIVSHSDTLKFYRDKLKESCKK